MNAVKNHYCDTDHYPSIDDILNAEDHVPELLKTFISEFKIPPLKQISASQLLFSLMRPRSLMPLPLALAIAIDNKLSSKWLINGLSPYAQVMMKLLGINKMFSNTMIWMMCLVL